MWRISLPFTAFIRVQLPDRVGTSLYLNGPVSAVPIGENRGDFSFGAFGLRDRGTSASSGLGGCQAGKWATSEALDAGNRGRFLYHLAVFSAFPDWGLMAKKVR